MYNLSLLWHKLSVEYIVHSDTILLAMFLQVVENKKQNTIYSASLRKCLGEDWNEQEEKYQQCLQSWKQSI